MGESRVIDDSYNRVQKDGSYKDKRFGGKRTIRDDYTNEKRFYGNKADAKHKHPLEKCADVDHITPLAVVRERYGDLSIEQQKALANAESNYAITSAQLNRYGKNSLENHEYVEKRVRQVGEDFLKKDYDRAKAGAGNLLNEAPRMLGKEVESRACMAVKATGYRVNNKLEKITDICPESLELSVSESIRAGNSAVMSAEIPLLTSVVTNTMQVVQGEISAQDGVSDAVVKIGGAWIQGVAAEEAKRVFGNSGNLKLPHIAEITGMPEVTTVVASFGSSFVQLVNGNIDEDEFVLNAGTEIAKRHMALAITKIAGKFMLSVPMTGQLIGMVIVSALCSKVENACKSVINVKKSLDHISDNAKEVSYLAGVARNEIEEQRKNFKLYTEQYNTKIKTVVNDAFQTVRQGVSEDSYEKTSEGLEKVANIFNATTSDINMQWLKNNWKGEAGSWG